MTILNSSILSGLVVSRTRVGEPIRASDVRVVMQDMAHVYERTTGLAADQAGTAASTTNAQHTHDEEGNLIVRHFVSWQYGTRGPNGVKNAELDVVAYAAPFTLAETSSTTADDNVLAMQPLIYVPSSWVDRDIVCILDTNGDPDMRATLYDDSNVAVTGYDAMRFQPVGALASQVAAAFASTYSDDPWTIVFQVPSAGLYWLDVRTTLRAGTGFRQIYGGTIVGLVDQSLMAPQGIDPPAPAASNVTQVGDPDASNAWQPMDDVFAPSGNGALHAALLTKMAENNNATYEHALGLPAPGRTAATLDGHAHTGAAGSGAEIDYPHCAGVLGGCVEFASATTEVFGQHSRAPNNITSTLETIVAGRTYMPDSVNVNATAPNLSSLKFAALIWATTGKGTRVPSVAATFGSTTKVFSGTTGGAGHEVLTTPTAGTNNFAYTANAINSWDIQARCSTVGTAGGYMQLCSFVWYVEG